MCDSSEFHSRRFGTHITFFPLSSRKSHHGTHPTTILSPMICGLAHHHQRPLYTKQTTWTPYSLDRDSDRCSKSTLTDRHRPPHVPHPTPSLFPNRPIITPSHIPPFHSSQTLHTHTHLCRLDLLSLGTSLRIPNRRLPPFAQFLKLAGVVAQVELCADEDDGRAGGCGGSVFGR